MAKEAKTSNLKTIVLIVGLVVIAAGGFANYVLQGATIASNKEDVVELKADGCKPAQKHVTDISLIQQSVKTIEKTVLDQGKTYVTSQEAILEAIKCLSTGKDSP